jgi:hypothetical protein
VVEEGVMLPGDMFRVHEAVTQTRLLSTPWDATSSMKSMTIACVYAGDMGMIVHTQPSEPYESFVMLRTNQGLTRFGWLYNADLVLVSR